MEFCPYCNIAPYNSYCLCNKTQEVCPYTYRCSTELRHKPTSAMNNCTIRKEFKMIPSNANKVRFEKHGKLFIEVDNFVIELNNPYDYSPEYVYLVNVNGDYFIRGYEPKLKEKKSTAKTFIIEE